MIEKILSIRREMWKEIEEVLDKTEKKLLALQDERL